MLKFRIILYTLLFSEIIYTSASELPTLTSLCSQAAVQSVQKHLNGHNWHYIEDELKRIMPYETFELLVKSFSDIYRYQLNPVPFRTLYQPEGVSALSMAAGNILIAESYSDTTHIWDIQRRRLIQTFDHPTARRSSLYLSPNKKIVVFTHAHGNIFVSDLENRRQLCVLSGHTQAVRTLLISDDNKLIISGSADETIRIWDIERATVLRICRGHIGSINSLDLSEDKKYIVSGGDDQTIRTWSVATGELISTSKGHHNEISCVKILKHGELIASSSYDGTICMWKIHSYKNPLEHFSQIVAFKKGLLGRLKFITHKYPHGSIATLGIISCLLGYYAATLC